MLVTKTRCAFRKHYTTGTILLSTLFTLISFVALVCLGINVMEHSDDIIHWVLMVAAIPLIRTEVEHYKKITHHLIRNGKGCIGSNTVRLYHENGKIHENSKLTRLRRNRQGK
jgi:hypothetical protein